MVSAEKLGSAAGCLRIGPITLSGAALLAPMAGVTDAGMRRAAQRRGAPLTFCEMVASSGFIEGEAECVNRAESADGGPFAVQLVGCEGAAMADAARRLEAEGAQLIDVNMGCPARRVAGAQAGSALMRDADAAVRLLAGVVAAVKIPVTVKMRLGWDESSRNAAALAHAAERVGVRMVSVHARTRAQFYSGAADWRAVAEVVDATTLPVVVNGDCRSLEDARAMLAASGAAAVMIGRAALGRPWLVGAVARALAHGGPVSPPPAAERHADARDHLEHLLTRMGRIAGLRHARKHLAAYVEAEGANADLRRTLVTADDPVDAFAALARAYAPALSEAA